MANYRRGRINDEMQKELMVILRGVKDPRVSDAFVSVTAVDVTPDLKYAKVYYSCLSGNKKDVAKGLRQASGYMRTQLAKTLNLRMTPELTFIRDTSLQHGAHIASLLHQIETESPQSEDEQDADESEGD